MQSRIFTHLFAIILLCCSSITAHAGGGPSPCIDSSLIDPNAVCPAVYAPVCGCDGVTYNNDCEARANGVTGWSNGPCGAAGCIANFSYYVNSGYAEFYDNSIGNYTNVQWDFGDSSTSNFPAPVHFYQSPGYYAVMLVIWDSARACRDTSYMTIFAGGGSTNCFDPTLVDSTQACFAVYDPVCGCDGVTYGNTCEATYYGGVTTWTPGRCGNNSVCQANFSYSVIIGIAGYTVTFNNLSSGPYTASYWSFGDGSYSTDPNPVYTYLTNNLPPLTEVCLTVSDLANGCSDQYCTIIDLNGSVNCVDSSLITGAACPLGIIPVCGCDGATYDNGCVAREQNGVTSWHIGACGTINTCNAVYDYSTTPLAIGTQVDFREYSTANINYWAWDFGDGSTGSTDQHPTHSYLVPGNYTVCLTAADTTGGGCSDTYCMVIDLYNPCVDSSVIDPTTVLCGSYDPVCGCNGISYNNSCEAYYFYGVTNWVPGTCNGCTAYYSYYNDSVPGGMYFFPFMTDSGTTDYLWDFGDGNITSAAVPYHMFPDTTGTFTVCLTVTDSSITCSNTYCETVYLGVPCVTAYFDWYADSIGNVAVSNTSQGQVSSVEWTVDGTVVDTMFNTAVSLPDSNDHVICLTVGVAGGICYDYYCDTVNYRLSSVEPISEADLQFNLFPNPASDKAFITYKLPKAAQVDVEVQDMTGRRVAELFSGKQQHGPQQLSWETGNIITGIYLVRITVDGQIYMRKVSVIK